MLEKQITFTYGELIEAFTVWDWSIKNNKIVETPLGTTPGEMFTNYLINTVNSIRADKLTSYRKDKD